MSSTVTRAIGLLVVGLGPAMLLAGCGGEETGARSTLAPIQPSSYVVRDPVTTTTVPEGETTNPDLDEDGRSRVAQEYTIQAGDVVSAIASRYGILMNDLAAFNEWPNGINQLIIPGQVIRIPPGALVPDAVTAVSPDPAAPAGGDGATAPQTTLAGADGECVEGSYTIVSGDIPIRVAQRFDVTLEQLNAANANTPGYAGFVVGVEIVIPC